MFTVSLSPFVYCSLSFVISLFSPSICLYGLLSFLSCGCFVVCYWNRINWFRWLDSRVGRVRDIDLNVFGCVYGAIQRVLNLKEAWKKDRDEECEQK